MDVKELLNIYCDIIETDDIETITASEGKVLGFLDDLSYCFYQLNPQDSIYEIDKLIICSEILWRSFWKKMNLNIKQNDSKVEKLAYFSSVCSMVCEIASFGFLSGNEICSLSESNWKNTLKYYKEFYDFILLYRNHCFDLDWVRQNLDELRKDLESEDELKLFWLLSESCLMYSKLLNESVMELK